MDTITFTNGYGTVTLPAPEPGANAETRRAQGVSITADGTRIVADGGTAARRIKLSVPGLTTAERAALETFFHNAARGMLRTFLYVDSSAVMQTVRFGEPALTWASPAATVHDVTFTLEETL